MEEEGVQIFCPHLFCRQHPSDIIPSKKKSNAQCPAQCAHVTAAPPTARMGLGGILGLIFGLLFGVILVAAAFFTCRWVVVFSFSFSNFLFSHCSHRPRERPKAINSRSSSKRNSGRQFDSQLGLITLMYIRSFISCLPCLRRQDSSSFETTDLKVPKTNEAQKQ